ncbi:MAG TPA: hypothetical protein VFF52_03675 [Isosphaeraceae bacterium]|nr:hypothetical protein [Isosphaeraceae bacterium]
MRQALTGMMVGLCLVLVPSARGDGPEAGGAGTIARARHLIEAGDHAAARTVLEDALLEVRAEDKAVILDLLRQTYAILARKAEESGKPADAAAYRDNLAILDRGRASPRPVPTRGPKPESSDRPKPAPVEGTAAGRPRGPERAPGRGAAGVQPVLASARGPGGPALAPVPAAAASPMPVPSPGRAAAMVPASGPGPDLSRPVLSEPEALPEPTPLPPPGPVPNAPAAAAASPPQAESLGSPGPALPVDPVLDRGRESSLDGTTGPSPAPAPSTTVLPPAGTETRSGPRVVGSDLARPPADPALDEADRLFAAGRYDEAGRAYATLARQNRLPANRREHWAYCRCDAVRRRINRHPRTEREWDEIEAEIQSIQRLAPGHWIGAYLHDKAAELRRLARGRRVSAPSENLVVRGSAPEEPPSPAPARRFPRLFGRSREPATAAPQPAGAPSASATPPALEPPLVLAGSTPGPALPRDPDQPASPGAGGGAGAGTRDVVVPAGAEPGEDPSQSRVEDGTPAGDGAAGPAAIAWQVHETPNFRIYHCEPALAQRAADVAESVRAAQAKRWGSPAARTTWSPRCDLYLYPNPRAYAQATGQPENSPGISTISNNGIRVLSRRMNLRADNRQLLSTILPHEVTHIVLADLFVARQIPRWADEGLAVLAEPLREQHLRAAELQGPLESGQLFDLAQLMTMDYPEAKDWTLYYAQSVSLTRYLVEQGPPEKFVQFVRESQRIGPEGALQGVYQIEGLPQLHQRWLAYARSQAAVATAGGGDTETRPARSERR